MSATERLAALTVLGALFVLPLYPKVGIAPVPGTYIPLRLDDVVVAIVAVAWLATLAVAHRRPNVPPVVAFAAGLWLAAGLVSVIVGSFVLGSVSPLTSLAFWAKPVEYLVVGAVVFDLRAKGALSTRAVLGVVFASAALVMVYALLERLALFLLIPGVVPPPGLVTSTFGDTHELSGYLGIVMLLIVALWPSAARAAVRGALLVGVVAGVAVMFFTGTRTEYLALAVALLLLLAWRPARAAALTGAVALALFFVSPYVLPTTSIDTSVTSRYTDESFGASLRDRIEVKWPQMIGSAMSSPIVGLGPSAATEAADGYYVRSFVESGILGLAAFLGLVAAVLYGLWSVARRSSGIQVSTSVAILMATLFVAAVGVLIDTWVASRVMELYWPMAGLALAASPAAASPAPA